MDVFNHEQLYLLLNKKTTHKCFRENESEISGRIM